MFTQKNDSDERSCRVVEILAMTKKEGLREKIYTTKNPPGWPDGLGGVSARPWIS